MSYWYPGRREDIVKDKELTEGLSVNLCAFLRVTLRNSYYTEVRGGCTEVHGGNII